MNRVIASACHPLGVAFYRKMGMELLGQFDWPFHDGEKWTTVTELIFGLQVY
jgi:hypothetical protein